MSNEENREIELIDNEVMKAEDVSVYFNARQSQDDYKSRLMNIFNPKKLRELREKRESEPQKIWPLKDISFSGYQGEILGIRSEEHTSELQSRGHLVCRLLLEKKK